MLEMLDRMRDGKNRRTMKWKLQSKYESNHGPGRHDPKPNGPEDQKQTKNRGGPPLWPTCPALSGLLAGQLDQRCLSAVPAAAAAVALSCGFWLQLHLALLFGFLFFCASAFPFYFCRHLALTIGQGVLPVCFLCSRHVLVLLKNISTYALCERVCVLCIVVVQ